MKNTPVIIVPDFPGAKSWSYARVWAKALSKRAADVALRMQAQSLTFALDAWLNVRDRPVLAECLRETINLIRDDFIKKGFTPPKFCPENASEAE